MTVGDVLRDLEALDPRPEPHRRDAFRRLESEGYDRSVEKMTANELRAAVYVYAPEPEPWAKKIEERVIDRAASAISNGRGKRYTGTYSTAPFLGAASDPGPPLPQPIVWSDFWQREHSQAWLCEPILPAGRLVAIYAQGKAGKSLLTLEMAAAISTCRPFLYQASGDPIDVVYIDAEMTEADLQARLLDMGYGPSDDLSRLHYYLLPTLPPLDTREGGDALLEIAQRHQAQAVIIDTVSRVISGAENDADTFLSLYRNTSMRLKAAEIALLRLDHTGKDATRGQRGSSAKAQDVDLAWNLTTTAGVGYTRVSLKLTESRLAHIANEVALNRYTEPILHHALPKGTVIGISDAAVKVLRMLEAEGITPETGRPTAGQALRDKGHTFSTSALEEAIRWRRTHPESGKGSLTGSTPRQVGGHAAGSDGHTAEIQP
jgi:hypothetical protein